MTELRIETYSLPGAPLGAENPLPFFRDPAVSRDVRVKADVPAEKRAWIGWETAFRVLPYRMQDSYTREKSRMDFRALVLENENLKATFLPEVGGRLVSLVYRPLERELLHRNPVFQPANLAIRNAWFSGGIEWNIGQLGHTFNTCAPVFAAAIEDEQGNPGLRLYEYERCKGLFWQIDFHLPPGAPFLAAYTRVVNPNDAQVAMYWWTNIAVNERPGTRVLAPARTALYADFEDGERAFGLNQVPGLPSLGGVDGTYSLNSTFANEFFFQCDETQTPWEAALDEAGSGLLEASTARLRYRKLFCWGTHAGGRHWQEFLAQPGEAYLEVQGGLAPTQVHGLPMPGRTTWDWTQFFGYLEADRARVHGSDWAAACGAVDEALAARLGESPALGLARIEERCRALAAQPAHELLQTGSGWGALELARRATPAAAGGCDFPAAVMGAEQDPWRVLLERGEFPAGDPLAAPGAWMVQPEWEVLLQSAVDAGRARNWAALLHLGVMRLERFDEQGAESAWLESLALQPTVWAARCLAVLALRQKDQQRAFGYYEQAWALAEAAGAIPAALAVEFLQTLVETGQFERGMAIYNRLPRETQHTDRVQILRGQFALALGDLDAVEETLQREYAGVREGETVLTDLWFELHAQRESRRSGRALDEALRREVRAAFPPPARIDFRSFK